MSWEGHSITAWNTKAESNYKEIMGGKSILKKEGTGFFKNINVIKDRRLWIYSRLKETKKTWQLSSIPDPRLDPKIKTKNSV